MIKNRQRLRRFIQETFSDEALSDFCFDYFPQVYHNFTIGMPKDQKVRMLVSRAESDNRFRDLHAALKRENRRAYDHAFPEGHALAQPPAPTVARNPKQIFLSHASEDEEFAQRLAADLHRHGWQIWTAPDSILPGEKWVEAINRGLAESGVFVLVLTESAINSRWVQTETNAAIGMEHRGELRLLPVSLEPVDAPAVWQAYQWIPFEQDYKRGLESLLAILQPEALAEIRQLHRRAQQAATLENWQQAIDLCAQIEAQYRDYRDIEALIDQANEQLARVQRRRVATEKVYTQLQLALTAENWGRSLTLAAQLEDIEPGYRDVARLAAEARQGQLDQENRERRAALQAEAKRLYSQLQAAVEAEKWSSALTLASQIEAQVPNYRDVATLAKLARQKQRAQRREQQPLLRWLRQLPSIVWMGGVGVIAIVLLVAFWPEGTVAPEVMPTQVAVGLANGTETPTMEQSSPVSAVEPSALTASSTPEPLTVTLSVVPSRTPAPQTPPTATPTFDPTNMPPIEADLGDTWTRSKDGMVMVYVPPPDASFMLESGVEAPTEGFWIDRYEVSNAQYQLCVDAGACEPATCGYEQPNEYPVIGVSFFDAEAYSAWVGGELPTEAQWEYAAVGESGFDYPWGNEVDGTLLNFCDVNCEFPYREAGIDDGYQATAPVDSFPGGASWVGALNMSGNVSEWAWSFGADDLYAMMPIRGGSWNLSSSSARATSRLILRPFYCNSYLGFRVVMQKSPSHLDP